MPATLHFVARSGAMGYFLTRSCNAAATETVVTITKPTDGHRSPTAPLTTAKQLMAPARTVSQFDPRGAFSFFSELVPGGTLITVIPSLHAAGTTRRLPLQRGPPSSLKHRPRRHAAFRPHRLARRVRGLTTIIDTVAEPRERRRKWRPEPDVADPDAAWAVAHAITEDMAGLFAHPLGWEDDHVGDAPTEAIDDLAEQLAADERAALYELLTESAHRLENAQLYQSDIVAWARHFGIAWQYIGEALGMSKQAAAVKFADPDRASWRRGRREIY